MALSKVAETALERQARLFLEISRTIPGGDVEDANFKTKIETCMAAMGADGVTEPRNAPAFQEIILGAQKHILKTLAIPEAEVDGYFSGGMPLTDTIFVKTIWDYLYDNPDHTTMNEVKIKTLHDNAMVAKDFAIMLQLVKQAESEKLAKIPGNFKYHALKALYLILAGVALLATAAAVVGAPALLGLVYPGTAGIVTSAAQVIGLGSVANAVTAAIAVMPATIAAKALAIGGAVALEVAGVFGAYKTVGWMKATYNTQHKDVIANNQARVPFTGSIKQISALENALDPKHVEEARKHTPRGFSAK